MIVDHVKIFHFDLGAKHMHFCRTLNDMMICLLVELEGFYDDLEMFKKKKITGPHLIRFDRYGHRND